MGWKTFVRRRELDPSLAFLRTREFGRLGAQARNRLTRFALAWSLVAIQPALAPAPISAQLAEPTPQDSAEADSAGRFYDYPNLTVLGFGAAWLEIDDETLGKDRGSDSTLFAKVDLFLMSQLSRRFSALAQASATEIEDRDTDPRVEQLELKFSASQRFDLRFGQFHTPLGYWNQTYHNVPWLRQTISRPQIFRLEGDGGLLPLYSVGARGTGKAELGAVNLNYEVGAVSGRRARPSHKIDLGDLGEVDGATLRLTLGFDVDRSRKTGTDKATRDLSLGASAYHENIEQELGDAFLATDIEETILGFFVAWTPSHFEAIGEFLNIRHRDETTGAKYQHDGYYLQWTTRWKRWQFYQRTDVLRFEPGDPYFSALDTRDLEKLTTGMRWTPARFAALSLEYAFNSLEGVEDFASFGLLGTLHFGNRE